ncbi:hypothetical protein SCG7086_AM_00030 [Chlamydiales bacterium SCGC AG-110-P3]|nr:hypothetical protein SCG7086_AM_00030 [Chlamydiales bacterium SCGC AG-110-P3]
MQLILNHLTKMRQIVLMGESKAGNPIKNTDQAVRLTS